MTIRILEMVFFSAFLSVFPLLFLFIPYAPQKHCSYKHKKQADHRCQYIIGGQGLSCFPVFRWQIRRIFCTDSPYQKPLGIHSISGAGHKRNIILVLYYLKAFRFFRFYNLYLVYLVGQCLTQHLDKEKIAISHQIQICKQSR